MESNSTPLPSLPPQPDGAVALQEFAAACGVPGGWTAELWERDDEGRFRIQAEMATSRPWLVVGRSRRCDVSFRKATVSARHTYVQAWGGRALCFDLDSRLGTRRDVLLPLSGSRPSAAEIGVGNDAVRLHATDSGRASGPASLKLQQETATFRLEFLPATRSGRPRRGKDSRIYCPRRAVTLMGRSTVCKVQLQDSSISRVHCSLVRTPCGVWIVDLLSRAGVRVNGRLVDFARLRHGDHLQIGCFEMNCLLDGSEGDTGCSPATVPSIQIQGGANVSAGHSAAPSPPPGESATGLTVAPELLLPAASSDHDSTGLISGFAAALARELAAVQQQMFDQSQQAMTLMTRMVGSLHHSQMQLLREELQQVQLLSRELAALRAERSSASPIDEPVASPNDGASGRSSLPVQSAESVPDATDTRQPPGDTDPDHAAAVEDSEPATVCSSASAGRASTPGDPLAGDPETADESRSPTWNRVSADHSQAATHSVDSTEGNQRGPMAGNKEVHLWLHERMASVDRERKTRWQRIMSLLNVGGEEHAYHKADVPD